MATRQPARKSHPANKGIAQATAMMKLHHARDTRLANKGMAQSDSDDEVAPSYTIAYEEMQYYFMQILV